MRRIEIYEDGEWKICDNLKVNFKTIWRSTGEIETKYYLGYGLHRIDGPAFIKKDDYGNVLAKQWYINSIVLVNFASYYNETNLAPMLFKYIKNYPQFLNEIVLLAKHNCWLTEQQISLLTTLDMFI
jgi:hypothetical protein